MIRRSAALVITLAASACASGTDDAAPATAITDPPPTVAITDAPSTTTAPTVATTTSTTSTTAAPTTTIDPIAEIEAAVQQSILDREDAYFAAASDPTNLALREPYRAAYAPGLFTDREAFLDELVANGTALRRSANSKTAVTFPSPIQIISGTNVSLEICRVDTDVIRIPPTVDSPEVIVDDRVTTTYTVTDFSLLDGRWVLSGGELIMRWQGSAACAV